MKAPRGFGKRYFTLASILAHSVQAKLESQTVKTDYLTSSRSPKEKEEMDESDPLLELLISPVILNAKPCHCNSFFKSRTRIILKINHYIPRCQYYTPCFAFRRTGVHPPFSIA